MRKKLLKEQLERFFSSGYDLEEVIVLNDGSKDNTKKLLINY